MNKDRDKDFLKRLKSGDKLAFEKLFTEYKNMIYTIVKRMVYNKNEVDDLVADIFIKIYQSIHRFEERAKLSTWMYRIAYNHCLDHIRKANRDPLESYEPLDSMFDLSSNGLDAEKMVLKEERANLVCLG
ncbi:MAG: sigma-70 family RNA polymerase sigma factor [candidate division WOR-3 bacterium]|nr:sigma-70 family RNA polymerase sigma factor [candidate division WOR-3 bacterium]